MEKGELKILSFVVVCKKCGRDIIHCGAYGSMDEIETELIKIGFIKRDNRWICTFCIEREMPERN